MASRLLSSKLAPNRYADLRSDNLRNSDIPREIRIDHGLESVTATKCQELYAGGARLMHVAADDNAGNHVVSEAALESTPR